MRRRVFSAVFFTSAALIIVFALVAAALDKGHTPLLAIAAAVAVAAAAGVSRVLAERIASPFENLNLDEPLSNENCEDISPLLTKLDRQAALIAEQEKLLRAKTAEFTQISGGMEEALVLLDRRNRILSFNPAAGRLFHADASCVGKDLLVLDRSRELSAAVASARSDGHADFRTARDGRYYRFSVSGIESEGETTGFVVLAVDVTEQVEAERARREFTANVSHELKTPLQSIMGGAELLESGLVAPGDEERIFGHIRTEAARMVSLVDDILRLSELDEGAPLPREEVDLLEASREAVRELSAAAKAKNVTLTAEGESVSVNGVRSLICEIIHNLCDNAVKYNVEGGFVRLTVRDLGKTASVTVSDTGIGIPPEYQERVFERFFRVDKSRSKASGGTGLGLSIVKHAVGYLGGRTELQSTPGAGTAITVTLPK